MRCRVNFTGQSKAVVPNVTIELDNSDDKIDTAQSDSALEEAKRIFNDAERFCMTKMR